MNTIMQRNVTRKKKQPLRKLGQPLVLAGENPTKNMKDRVLKSDEHPEGVNLLQVSLSGSVLAA